MEDGGCRFHPGRSPAKISKIISDEVREHKENTRWRLSSRERDAVVHKRERMSLFGPNAKAPLVMLWIGIENGRPSTRAALHCAAQRRSTPPSWPSGALSERLILVTMPSQARSSRFGYSR